MKPSRHQFTVQKHTVDLVPPNLVPKLARKYEVDKQNRQFTPGMVAIDDRYTLACFKRCTFFVLRCRCQ